MRESLTLHKGSQVAGYAPILGFVFAFASLLFVLIGSPSFQLVIVLLLCSVAVVVASVTTTSTSMFAVALLGALGFYTLRPTILGEAFGYLGAMIACLLVAFVWSRAGKSVLDTLKVILAALTAMWVWVIVVEITRGGQVYAAIVSGLAATAALVGYYLLGSTPGGPVLLRVLKSLATVQMLPYLIEFVGGSFSSGPRLRFSLGDIGGRPSD